MPIKVLEHPLADHLLAGLRNLETPPQEFRRLCKLLTTLLVLEATASIKRQTIEIKTPLTSTTGSRIGQALAVVPVLRAGLGMLEPVLELFPDVAVGYIGLERHEETAIARSYYSKLPPLKECFALCLDPMLATGGSSSQAISLIKAHGAEKIVMVSVVAAPEGVAKLTKDHPEVLIVTAALDSHLDDRKYIVPGLGDFGDRLYATS